MIRCLLRSAGTCVSFRLKAHCMVFLFCSHRPLMPRTQLVCWFVCGRLIRIKPKINLFDSRRMAEESALPCFFRRNICNVYDWAFHQFLYIWTYRSEFLSFGGEDWERTERTGGVRVVSKTGCASLFILVSLSVSILFEFGMFLGGALAAEKIIHIYTGTRGNSFSSTRSSALQGGIFRDF